MDWQQILKHLHQQFSPEYKWYVGGAVGGKHKITVQKMHAVLIC